MTDVSRLEHWMHALTGSFSLGIEVGRVYSRGHGTFVDITKRGKMTLPLLLLLMTLRVLCVQPSVSIWRLAATFDLFLCFSRILVRNRRVAIVDAWVVSNVNLFLMLLSAEGSLCELRFRLLCESHLRWLQSHAQQVEITGRGIEKNNSIPALLLKFSLLSYF